MKGNNFISYVKFVIIMMCLSYFVAFRLYCNDQIKINDKYSIDYSNFKPNSYFTCGKISNMKIKGWKVLFRLESQVPGLNYETDMQKFISENDIFRKNNCNNEFECRKTIVYTIYNYGSKNRILISAGDDIKNIMSINELNLIVQNSGPKIIKAGSGNEYTNKYDLAFEQAIYDFDSKITKYYSFCNGQLQINSRYNFDYLQFTPTSLYTCLKINTIKNKGWLLLFRLETQLSSLNFDTEREKFAMENENYRKNNCGTTYQCSKSLSFTVYNYGTKNRILISTGTDMSKVITAYDLGNIIQNSGSKIAKEAEGNEFTNKYELVFQQAIMDIEVLINRGGKYFSEISFLKFLE